MMTDHYQIGPLSRNCVGLSNQEHGNNQRRRRSNYDDYSESCYDDDDPDEDESGHDGACQCMRCPAHLFTSVLLGLLACVLVTGGVFLAFHKWDHTWLLVSGIGVILMAIGTAMHCCSTPNSNKQTGSHRCKGGCAGGNNNGSRNHTNQKGTEIIGNGSVLTEQLLPLSNTRSVSQLSLNMVPGYFPPLVYSANGAPYSLEQHSAVVQNINRLVQHQTQLHLQQPDTNVQPGINGAKSFILVPLPSQGADTTSIQNIVAAVCQLDAVNNSSEVERHEVQTAETVSQSSLAINENITRNAATAGQLQQPIQTSSSQPLYKHVEVQTCNEWNLSSQISNEGKPPNHVSATSACSRTNGMGYSSNVSTEISCQTTSAETLPITCLLETSNSNNEELRLLNHSGQPTNENIVEQQNDVVSSGSPCNSVSCDNPIIDSIPNLVTFDNSPAVEADTSSASVVDESESIVAISINDTINNTQYEAISEQITQSAITIPTSNCVLSSDIIISPAEPTEITNSSCQSSGENIEDESAQNITPLSSENSSEIQASLVLIENIPNSTENIPNSTENIPSSCEDITLADSSDFDESEFLERSSPPPSYEDVAQEAASSGGIFGSSYGTM